MSMEMRRTGVGWFMLRFGGIAVVSLFLFLGPMIKGGAVEVFDNSVPVDEELNIQESIYDNTDGGYSEVSGQLSPTKEEDKALSDILEEENPAGDGNPESFLEMYPTAITAGLFAVPSVVLIPISPDPTSNVTPTLSGTATADSETISSVTYNNGGNLPVERDCEPVDGKFDEVVEDFTCTVAYALPEGVNRYYVVATDSRGQSTLPGSVYDEFVVDTTPPVISIAGLPGDLTNSTTPSIPAIVTDQASIIEKASFQVDGLDGAWIDCLAADGTYDEQEEEVSCQITDQLLDGIHTIYITASDHLGNEHSSGNESSYLFMVDTVVLLQSVTVGTEGVPSGGTIIVNSQRPMFSGITEPWGSVTVSIYSQEITGTVQADDQGYWSWTPEIDIPFGEHSVLIAVTDLAGNNSQRQFFLTVYQGLVDTGDGASIEMAVGGLLLYMAIIRKGFKKKLTRLCVEG